MDSTIQCVGCGCEYCENEMYYDGEWQCLDCHVDWLSQDCRSMCYKCSDDYPDDDEEWIMSENEHGEDIRLCQKCYKGWNSKTYADKIKDARAIVLSELVAHVASERQARMDFASAEWQSWLW